MLFNSYQYFIFLTLVVIIYYSIPNYKVQNIFLLLSSYFFYLSWNEDLFYVIIGITLISYLGAVLISYVRQECRKKIICIFTVIVSLGVLFVFKYFDFFSQSATIVYNFFAKKKIQTFKLNLLLPIGLSYYTFQAVAYLVGVYRAKIKVEKNIVDYALYISFFPHLIAGPIERPVTFLPQIKYRHKFSTENLLIGLYLFLWGMFKKLVIADRLAIYINEVYDNVTNYSALTIICATVAFSLQIYCDFSGYSEMARGTAKILDFNLIDNFETPYFATSIKEFWHRWHISLSQWFRDYIYIPLGGNRKSAARTRINVIVTFLVSGLWHGASWTYIIWGCVHGIFQVIESFIEGKVKIENGKGVEFAKGVITFSLVTFAWIFFRANSLQDVIYILHSFGNWNVANFIAEQHKMIDIGVDAQYWLIIIILYLIVVINDIIRKRMGTYWFLNRINGCGLVFFMSFIYICIILFGIYGPMFNASAFIYYKF